MRRDGSCSGALITVEAFTNDPRFAADAFASFADMSVLDSVEFPRSLSALQDLKALLSCSSCRGPPGDSPSLLDGCVKSIATRDQK